MTNDGSITQVFTPYPSNIPANTRSSQSAIRATGSGSQITNRGIISSGGGRGEAISMVNANGTVITNEAGASILATNATRAIAAGGNGIHVINSGRIAGGSEDAIAFTGENGILTLREGSQLTGDVISTAVGEVLKTMREIGLDPSNPQQVARYNAACRTGTPQGFCTKRVTKFSDRATVEYETSTAVTVDPSQTRFRGINRFVLSGNGPLTLGQNFAAGNELAPRESRRT